MKRQTERLEDHQILLKFQSDAQREQERLKTQRLTKISQEQEALNANRMQLQLKKSQ